MLTTDSNTNHKERIQEIGFLLLSPYFGTATVLIDRDVSVFIKLYIGTIFSEHKNSEFSDLLSVKSF